MKIDIGTYYENKTWTYLLPCLKTYGSQFISKYNSVFKLAVGIHDTALDGSPLIKGRNIYILLNSKFNPDRFYDFLGWIKHQPYYVTDYTAYLGVYEKMLHMLVLKIPKIYESSYDNFLLGKYSKMYSKEQLKELFYLENYNGSELSGVEKVGNSFFKKGYSVLIKNPNTVDIYIKKVKEIFGESIEKKDICSDHEYDFPLLKEEEIFNCSKGEHIYFNPEIHKIWSNE